MHINTKSNLLPMKPFEVVDGSSSLLSALLSSLKSFLLDVSVRCDAYFLIKVLIIWLMDKKMSRTLGFYMP